MRNSHLILPLICIFIFVACSTLVAYALSKAIPRIWQINKVVAGICLTLSIAAVSIVMTRNYLRFQPNAFFHTAFGFEPPSDIREIQVSSIQRGDEETNELIFSANSATFDKIRGNCFVTIPEESVKEDHYAKELLGRPDSLYFRRLNRSIDSDVPIGCEHPAAAFLRYDNEDKRVYVVWKLYYW
jgi:hypothetical protein